MRFDRTVKTLLAVSVSALVSLFLVRALGVPPRTGFAMVASPVLIAGGIISLTHARDGTLARPKLLIWIAAAAGTAIVVLVLLAWYALANSTDL